MSLRMLLIGNEIKKKINSFTESTPYGVLSVWVYGLNPKILTWYLI